MRDVEDDPTSARTELLSTDIARLRERTDLLESEEMGWSTVEFECKVQKKSIK